MIQVRRFASALGGAFWITGLVLLLPIPIAYFTDPEGSSLAAPLRTYGLPAALAFLVWLLLRTISRRGDNQDLQDREAILATAIGWLCAAALCGLPFYLSANLSPIGTLLEGMAGLTGTGFTLIPYTPDIVPSLRLWRGLLPLIGGLATVVLFAALLTRLSPGVAPATDLPGKQSHRIRPKLRETARTLTAFYVAIAGLFAGTFTWLLWRQGQSVAAAAQDAVMLVGATFGTGGIGAHPSGLAGYDVATQLVGYFACFLGATSLTLLFLLVVKGDIRLLRDPEWRFFIITLAVAFVMVALILVRAGTETQDSINAAATSVLSTATGAGGLVGQLPDSAGAGLLILLLMLVGGTSGSAAGGIKAFRWMVAWKAALREVRKSAHPRAILPIRLGNRVLPEDIVNSVLGFFILSLGIWSIGTLSIVLFSPLRVLEAATLSASALANVGSLGATVLDPASQTVLTILMWAGRLEILVVLLALNPRSWRL